MKFPVPSLTGVIPADSLKDYVPYHSSDYVFIGFATPRSSAEDPLGPLAVFVAISFVLAWLTVLPLWIMDPDSSAYLALVGVVGSLGD